MYVLKRNGKKEKVNVEKIISRIDKQCYNLDTKWIIPFEVAQKVFEGVYDGVTSRQLDELASETAAALTTKHPDYSILAARLAITSHHKDTKKSFYDTVKDLYKKKIVSKELMDSTEKYAEDIEAAIVHSRDLTYDYFGFKTLMRSYLLKINGKIVERPQHMIMRVALGIQDNDIKKAIEMYHLISEGFYTHATPTLFNAGTNMPQMSSCFIAGTKIPTINRGLLNIEDVEINDLVVTHLGNIKPVLQLHKNLLNDRQLYDVKVYKTPAVTVTDNHEFMSITKEQISWNEKPQWNSIDKLRIGDYIAISHLNKETKATLNTEFEIHDNVLDLKPNRSMIIEGVKYFKISVKKKNLTTPEYVYTLGVKDDHSYNVSGLVAKNCFLLQMQDDSIDGIYDTLKQVAKISKTAGGIGIAISNVRSKGSLIRGTNGESDGIVPMLKVFNETGRYVNQSGKRKGSIAVYLEPWHADIMDFLDLKKNTGKDEVRTRDLFLAMWMNDLFMQRLEKNEIWTLMNPDESKGLQEVYGEDFNKLYESYEREGKFVRQLPTRDVWNAILQSQTETGVPYIAFKDAANEKSNQKNLGTLKTSNLCLRRDTMLSVNYTLNDVEVYEDLKIEDVTVLFEKGVSLKVKSYNVDTLEVEYKNITNAAMTHPNAELLKISDESGKSIFCTAEHQIYTKNRGYIMAKDLKENDVLNIE